MILPNTPNIEGDPAAVMIDADATPLASIPDPADEMAVARFRDAAVDQALAHEGGAVAGVLFAARWGGSGVMLT